jgi:hypothetical protein
MCRWRNCVHDQETLTEILLIIITVDMIDKISFMPDGKYWAYCRLNGGSGPFLERRNFRIFLNCHWWDLINTNLHCLHCLCNIAHWVSGSRLPYCLKYQRCNFFATSHIYRRFGSLHHPQSCSWHFLYPGHAMGIEWWQLFELNCWPLDNPCHQRIFINTESHLA